MSRVYNNWERLVEATLDRERLRELALCQSFSSSIASDFSSSVASSFSSSTVSSFISDSVVKPILAKPIQLSDLVIKAADEAASFERECSELKSKTKELAGLLRHSARTRNELYERPTRRIIDETNQVLDKALSLVLKCRSNGIMKRVFTTIPPASAFRKMSDQLENSIRNVSWLLCISTSGEDYFDEYPGLPPILVNEPILALTWEHIAILYSSPSIDERSSEAAAALVSLARDNDQYRKLIVEEGGVGPLLKLVKEGKLEGQENAARAIGLLGNDPESVEHMINAGVCSVFAKVLREGPLKLQAVVVWAISELAAHHPKCQDIFARHNIIRLLIGHLAFETLPEHSKYAVISKATAMHPALVLASTNTNTNRNTDRNDLDDENTPVPHHPITKSNRAREMEDADAKAYVKVMAAREMEDPDTKAYIKAMAARALSHLARGNPPICRSIAESRCLLCFAVLLEKGPEQVQRYSAMALMEITAVAEVNSELRRSAFRPNSPVCKAVVDQLFKVIEKADPELLVPCVKAIGNLARSFRATETRMISPLVKLLDEREVEVTREACIALTKFACWDNFLHLDHSKAIVSAGAAKHLVQLVYFGEEIVKGPALILLCYISLHVPDHEELVQLEVHVVLEWASKQAYLMQVENVARLVPEAKEKLELYRSRGYH